jgi:predicted proteasome-type protease
MTYRLGIIMREGLVMASDSRSNASLGEVNVCQKMHTIVDPGECVFILLTSGNLCCSQSILTLVRRDLTRARILPLPRPCTTPPESRANRCGPSRTWTSQI